MSIDIDSNESEISHHNDECDDNEDHEEIFLKSIILEYSND